jgi:hypothetical protein
LAIRTGMLAAKRHDKDVKGCSFPKEREATAEAECQQLTLSLLIRTADQVCRIGLFVKTISRPNSAITRVNSSLERRTKSPTILETR